MKEFHHGLEKAIYHSLLKKPEYKQSLWINSISQIVWFLQVLSYFTCESIQTNLIVRFSNVLSVLHLLGNFCFYL